MARAKQNASHTSHASAPADADTIDATPLDTLIEQQRDLLDTALGQWTQSQQALVTAWFEWLDGLGGLYGAWRLPAWPGVPEEVLLAGPRLLQTWWAPWTPMVQRGTEQLG